MTQSKEINTYMNQLGSEAKEASLILAQASLEQKNEPEWAGIIAGLVWVIWWSFTGTLLILLASLPFLLTAN